MRSPKSLLHWFRQWRLSPGLLALALGTIVLELSVGTLVLHLTLDPSPTPVQIQNGDLTAILNSPQQALSQTLAWVEGLGLWAGFVFILIYILATVAFLPGAALTLGAGVLFGVGFGSLYVFLGATLGAILAFLVGRYLARSWVALKIAQNDQFQALDRAVAQQGLKIVLLTRLSPLFPFNLLNYAFGITGVSLLDYSLGSIGMLPGTIMYVYLGSLAGDLARLGGEAPDPGNTGLHWVLNGVGLLATIVVTTYVARLANQAFKETVDQPTPPPPDPDA